MRKCFKRSEYLESSSLEMNKVIISERSKVKMFKQNKMNVGKRIREMAFSSFFNINQQSNVFEHLR